MCYVELQLQFYKLYVMAELLSSDDCEVEDPKLGTSIESQQDRGTTSTADSSDIEYMGVEYDNTWHPLTVVLTFNTAGITVTTRC